MLVENENYHQTREALGWKALQEADEKTYQDLGFKCGLEVHQQLGTDKKLFCRCPAGIYHDFNDFDAEIVRHMRPTLSELGEYDGTALMEFKTRKKIIYRIKNDTACTYEIDDTPPFPINRQALEHAMVIALQLKMNIVGELHITRKQYLDGSIPTGFQRTTILGIEGSIPLSNKDIGIIQFSVEEDSCREVSDYRHTRVYYGDRLGMPLCEVVTYPQMLTPWEAAEAGYHIRYLTRSSGVVRRGIGAARQDVNVSITGGTRVEIKGVSHISWIPKLTHIEAFRQKALLRIKDLLRDSISHPERWKQVVVELGFEEWKQIPLFRRLDSEGWKLMAVKLPHFGGILSHFTQPNQCFADEISQRLKVIACLEHPNMFHSEELYQNLSLQTWKDLKTKLSASAKDAIILLWAAHEDIKTALETIEERCRMAFLGVPNETRKALDNGTTIFERVLPGADRMYPDTDSAPIPIHEDMIEAARKKLPLALSDRLKQLRDWKVPTDCYAYLLRYNLPPVIEAMSIQLDFSALALCKLFAHTIKSMQADKPLPFDYERVADLIRYLKKKSITFELLPSMLKVLFAHPNMVFSSILNQIGYKSCTMEDLTAQVPLLHGMFHKIKKRDRDTEIAEINWIMGRLKKPALGNVPLAELRTQIQSFLNMENHDA